MSQTLLAPAHHELIIKKSRFIACVQPMPDRAGAQKVVASLRAGHPGAAKGQRENRRGAREFRYDSLINRYRIVP